MQALMDTRAQGLAVDSCGQVQTLGPWDAVVVPDAVMTCDRHWLGVYVHTACAQFHVPPGVRVIENRPAGGCADGLHVVLEDICVVISVHGAARSEPLWPQHRRLLIDEIAAAGGALSAVSGVGGERICAVLPAQEIIAAGVDGPRWMVRAVAYGRDFVGRDVHGLLDELLADFVVFRGPGPVGPGMPLDMAVLASPFRHVTTPFSGVIENSQARLI